MGMKASAYEFSCIVDSQLQALPEKEYLLRAGHASRAKKLREELYPLSRLALHFKRPGTEVEVEAFEDCRRGDGHISITGYFEREFAVEITFAGYGPEDALRTQLLVSQGYCPGAGSIRRDKSRKIVANQGGRDVGEHIGRVAKAVLEGFLGKVTKKYQLDTILLVAFEEPGLDGCKNWHQLLTAIDEIGGMATGIFGAVYLFNGWTNELFRAA